MYKIINNKLTQTQETETMQEVDAFYINEKEQSVPIKVQVPIITFQEISPDPASQVIENMNYDLEKLKGEVNAKIAEYNAMLEKHNLIKVDLPDVGLTEAVAIEVIKETPMGWLL